MLARILSIIREAPDAPRISDAKVVDDLYRRRRNEALLGSMCGYALFYLCRKNISVGLPLLLKEPGVTAAAVGDLNAVLYITYGVSKFVFGLVADRSSPRALLLLGLVLSACANAAFGASTSLAMLGAIWAVNGVFQGTGAPASAKVVATWFSANERGTKTAIWNISHQVGGGLALALAGLLASQWGWRACFLGPALVVLGGALIVAPVLHDRPEASGLPPIEEHRNDAPPGEDEARDVPFPQLVVSRILLNPRAWVVALASGCTYIARYGALDWAPAYLYQVRGSSIGGAALNTTLLELCGIPGALLCGALSDRWFQGRRAPVVLFSLLGLAASTALLVRLPAGRPELDAGVLALMGFFTYGPQCMLAGVAPVDASSRRVAAAAIGFTGLVSYAGSAIGSSVIGRLREARGWESCFDFVALAALAGAALCLPLWRARPGR